MAFGDLKDAASFNPTTTSTSNALTMGGITANVGDLVYALFVEDTNLTVSGVTDNLGNTYTALNAGTDAGAVTARAFYSVVTTAGVLNTITFAATGSADDHCRLAILLEGPISAIDKNLANITSDVASPFSCPATGTLAVADEIVVAWGAANYNVNWLASSPMVRQIQDLVGAIKGAIASKVVAVTTTTTPAFTAVSNPTQAILATSSFKKAVVDTITVTQATVTLAGKTVTVRDHERPAVAKATVTLTGKTVTVGDTELVPVAKASVTIAGQSVDIVEVTSIIPVTAATVLFTGKTVNIVDSTPTFDTVSVSNALVALAGKTVTVSDFPTLIAVASAAIALTGKPVTVRETSAIPVNKATVTFTGKTVTVSTSTFQDIPKYIIRGRGSRHELWTQSYGGTIKGRGSRSFLVMR